MATKIRDLYGLDFAQGLAGRLQAVDPAFGAQAMLAFLKAHLGEEPFLARMALYADALETGLGRDYLDALALFHQALGPVLPGETGMFTTGYWLWPIARFVQRHCLAAPLESLAFIRELTCRHTGEFAVRPLLAQRPDLAMQAFDAWSLDPCVHVRRLASEGMRPRLPWAARCDAALDFPETYARVLARLKDDPSRFVQKSVGNNLNDLYRVRPAMAEGIIASWQQGELSPQAEWVIRHARRRLRRGADSKSNMKPASADR